MRKLMATSRYSTVQASQVENMLREGHTFPQIMQATQLNRNAVDYICRKFKKNGGIRGTRQNVCRLEGGLSGIKQTPSSRANISLPLSPPSRRHTRRLMSNGGQGGVQGNAAWKAGILDLSEIANITDMSASERLKLWLKYWQATFELARDDEDLASLRPLLAQFAAKLVERQSSEPIIQIQPIEFSPVIIPRPVNALAHDLCSAVVDLLKANLVIDDDAQQLLNALVKYCSHLTPKE
jgi:hypothetical protein